MNTYLYANGNPLGFSDPEGKNPFLLLLIDAKAVYKIASEARRLLVKAGFDVEIAVHNAHHRFNGEYKKHYQMRIVNHKLKLFARLQLAYGGGVPRNSGQNRIIIPR